MITGNNWANYCCNNLPGYLQGYEEGFDDCKDMFVKEIELLLKKLKQTKGLN